MKLANHAVPFFSGLLLYSPPFQAGEPRLPELTWWGALLVFFAVLIVVAWALIWNARQEPGITIHEEHAAEIADELTPTEHA